MEAPPVLGRTRAKTRLCRELEASAGFEVAQALKGASVQAVAVDANNPAVPASKARTKGDHRPQPPPKSGRARHRKTPSPRQVRAGPDSAYPPRPPPVGKKFQASVPVRRALNKRKRASEEERGGVLLWQPTDSQASTEAYLQAVVDLLTREAMEGALGKDLGGRLLATMSVQEFALLHLMLNEHDVRRAYAAIPSLAASRSVQRVLVGEERGGKRKAASPLSSLHDSAAFALRKPGT